MRCPVLAYDCGAGYWHSVWYVLSTGIAHSGCLVLTQQLLRATGLRGCYAMPGTDVAYGPRWA
eukprot:3789237-Rhodomonas_salina.5